MEEGGGTGGGTTGGGTTDGGTTGGGTTGGGTAIGDIGSLAGGSGGGALSSGGGARSAMGMVTPAITATRARHVPSVSGDRAHSTFPLASDSSKVATKPSPPREKAARIRSAAGSEAGTKGSRPSREATMSRSVFSEGHPATDE